MDKSMTVDRSGNSGVRGWHLGTPILFRGFRPHVERKSGSDL